MTESPPESPPRWSGPSRIYPAGRVSDFIGAQVQKSPDATAVHFEGSILSYAELWERAGRLAVRLRDEGVGPDVLVGVWAERSVELVVALLATLRAGGAYVPIDPGYPPDRVAFMLRDAAPPVLLVQRRLRAGLPALDCKVVELYGEGAHRSPAPSLDEPDGANDDLAYVIYTSGSTGQPKGAMVAHRSLANRLFWMQEAYPIDDRDAVLQKTPFSFDVSVWEFFWPLMTGARLIVAKPEGHRDASYLADLIEREQVSIVHFVPSMLRLFLDEPDLKRRCRSLRHVICSGEALDFDLQEKFFAELDAPLHNLYGPTEAAIDVTHWTCRHDAAEKVVPIGHPVSNTQIYILDTERKPVADGVEGELYIGGVQVGRGYLGRPELTAERFVPDPFREDPDARLYKTGDLARRREDGAVEFLGRMDYQIKLRGFRIELGEIEAHLNHHPAVRQSVVTAHAVGGGEQQLVAFLVWRDRPATHQEMTRFLAETLPAYMVPSMFVSLSEMPLSPNGKIDRKRLPAPERKRPDLLQPYTPPRSALERFLCRVWAEVLGLDHVGLNDTFFELGGTSLQAARAVNRVQKELRGEFIYVVTLFDAPTAAQYAKMLERDYPDAVRERFGGNARHARTPLGRPAVTPEKFERFQNIVPRLPDRPVSPRAVKNPPAIFILAPPRSGTTLLRVMLAGHPGLFAASELQLLCFHTMAERRKAFTGRLGAWLEGTVRAVMELKCCNAEQAKEFIEQLEAEATTQDFYRWLQKLAGDRILVDKSPHYALDPGCLAKAERVFENPLYIHLGRHPAAMVKSFEGYHLDQVLYLHSDEFRGRELGEMVWTASHQNVLAFLEKIPGHRRFFSRFEDLVARPEEEMRRMCSTFGFDYHPGLIDPYQNLDRKMVDGLYADSTPMGDTKLLERQRIDPAMAKVRLGGDAHSLCEETWVVARQLGYSPQGDASSATTPGSSTRRSRHLRQQARRRRRGASTERLPQ